MMGVNLDLKVGGSADYTMDSEYTEGIHKIVSGMVQRIFYNNIVMQCSTQTVQITLIAISNIDSLTSAHQSQLVELR